MTATTDAPKPAVGPTPLFDALAAELGEPDLTPAPTYEHVLGEAAKK